MATFDSYIRQWSTTVASNGVTPNVTPYGAQIGWAPSDVGGLVRQHMTDLRYQFADAEWFDHGHSAISVASASSFKVNGVNVTSLYMADLRIKILDTTTLYGTVVSSSFSTDTTVNVMLDSGALASASKVALAILKPTNMSIPRNAGTQPNIIIGGNFTTNPWQRGTTFTAVANAAVTYTADRFCINRNNDAVVDVLQTNDAPTIAQAGIFTQQCFHHDVTTADAAIAAGQYEMVRYVVEGYDASEIGFGQTNAKQITLSFWHKHTKTGTYCVAFTNSANDRSYIAEYTQAVTNTWEKAVITITADTAGTWLYSTGTGVGILFAIAIGATFQTAANAWTAGQYFSSASQVNGLDSNSNNFKLALVKLEIGSVATPYPVELEADVLVRCSRYYQKTFEPGTAPAQNVGSAVGALQYTAILATAITNSRQWNFTPKMRTVPTMVYYSTGAASTAWYSVDRAAASGASTQLSNGSAGVTVANAQLAADAVGQLIAIHATADAEL